MWLRFDPIEQASFSAFFVNTFDLAPTNDQLVRLTRATITDDEVTNAKSRTNIHADAWAGAVHS